MTSPATSAAFRGDGGLLVAGFDDGAVRLQDLTTSQQIGPTLSMSSTVEAVGFSPDGRTVYAIDRAGEFRNWPVHDPLGDASLDDLTLRLEARTGLLMDASLAISRLDPKAWHERLERLGRLDPTALKIDDGPAWHEPMAREAERTGNAFAAIWHLDRLIAARPDDWHLYARRARAWSRFDGVEKAAADFHQADRLGHREESLNFQDHYVIDCISAGRWPEAFWYLDRLIVARPDDVSLHENRAAACGKLGRDADRQAALARVFELGADEEMVIRRSAELGRDDRWPEAASLLARRGRKSFLGPNLVQAWGIACLKAGDQAGYREVCAAVMAREGPDPTVFWNALSEASLLVLAPGAIEDYRVPISYYERRLSALPSMAPFIQHLISNALGGLLLRAGRIDEAIALIEGGISAAKEPEIPTDWGFLALAHVQRGNFAEACRWLDRLRGVPQAPSDSLWDLQELALLREEAESLLSDAAFPSDPFQRSNPPISE